MSTPLYTLRAIALQLGLPESTVRYYRDVFVRYIPAAGRGRRRRYPPEAVERLRLVAEGFAENHTREEIEQALIEESGAQPMALPMTHTASGLAGASARELLATVLEGEQERREVLWQMAQEIVRLGEAIERQHLLLGEVSQQLDGRAARALPPASAALDSEPVRETSRVQGELDALRQELERERDLVDRLRRSKLEFERRAAAAEAALDEGPEPQLRSLFRRGKPRGAD
jgi:DNA-binding transcriptional MerR regulator